VKTIQIEANGAGDNCIIEVEKDGREYVVTAWVPFDDNPESETFTNKKKAITRAKELAKEIETRHAE